MRIGCVVMASGAGKRFGSNKLLAPLAGEPLVARTIASVPRDRYDLVVSTRWPEVAQLAEELGVCVARHEGVLRSESVRAGLAAGAGRGWRGCLFVPGDQPLVTRASYEALAEAFEADPACAHRLAWQGTPASPVLFPASCFSALAHLAGKDGCSSLLRAGAVAVRCVEALDARELADVDTPEDLARLSLAGTGLMGNSARPLRCR